MKYDNGEILALFSQNMSRDEINLAVFKKTQPLVGRLTKKYRKFLSYLDITQEGYKALFHAIKTFDPEACPNFYGWAFIHVKKAVYRSAYHFKLYSERFQLTGNTEYLLEGEAAEFTPEDILFNIEKSNILEKASNKLGKETQYIIKKLFGIGNIEQETIIELESNIRVSRHRIRKIRDIGLEQMRREQAIFEGLR